MQECDSRWDDRRADERDIRLNSIFITPLDSFNVITNEGSFINENKYILIELHKYKCILL